MELFISGRKFRIKRYDNLPHTEIALYLERESYGWLPIAEAVLDRNQQKAIANWYSLNDSQFGQITTAISEVMYRGTTEQIGRWLANAHPEFHNH